MSAQPGRDAAPTQTTCPECMEAFEADSPAVKYCCPCYDAVFFPGDDPLGTDLKDEI
jgi:hypothetical protein